jgi:hypothetical protein
MSEALEWLQLPPKTIAEALKNKKLTANVAKIVEVARSSETEPTKSKVSCLCLLLAYFEIIHSK